jgi:hypothetical protein
MRNIVIGTSETLLLELRLRSNGGRYISSNSSEIIPVWTAERVTQWSWSSTT